MHEFCSELLVHLIFCTIKIILLSVACFIVLSRWINPLNTKRRLLYLKTQFVPRSKHFSSRL